MILTHYLRLFVCLFVCFSAKVRACGHANIPGDESMRTLTAKAPFKSSLMRLNVCQPGLLNAVVYWHDVDGVDGFAHNARIVHLDRTVRVEAASKVSVIGGCAGGGARTFKLRGNVVRTIFSSYSEGIISSYRVLHRSNFTPSRHDDAMITGHAPGAASLGGDVGRRGERGEPALPARALLRADPPRVPWGRRTRPDGHLEGRLGGAPVRR